MQKEAMQYQRERDEKRDEQLGQLLSVLTKLADPNRYEGYNC